jgi:hypothetical protein
VPFFECFFDLGETIFFFFTVCLEVFLEGISKGSEWDLRPIETGDCFVKIMERGRVLSSLWIALEWVVEREPNIRPWKALPKDKIARSGEPGF